MSYISLDRQDVAQASLDEALSSLSKIHDNRHLCQYAIISLHHALQCYVSIALRGSTGIEILKKKCAKKLLNAWETGISSEEIAVQLDYFMELYDKLFINKPEEQRERVKWLNETRNDLIHFIEGSLIIPEPTMISVFLQVLEDIKSTPRLSKGIMFYEEVQEAKFISSCNKLTCLLEKLNKSTPTIPAHRMM